MVVESDNIGKLEGLMELNNIQIIYCINGKPNHGTVDMWIRHINENAKGHIIRSIRIRKTGIKTRYKDGSYHWMTGPTYAYCFICGNVHKKPMCHDYDDEACIQTMFHDDDDEVERAYEEAEHDKNVMTDHKVIYSGKCPDCKCQLKMCLPNLQCQIAMEIDCYNDKYIESRTLDEAFEEISSDALSELDGGKNPVSHTTWMCPNCGHIYDDDDYDVCI